MGLQTCEECNGRITDGEIGHRADCSLYCDDCGAEYGEKWLASRPTAVQEAVEKYPPSHLYRITSGHKVVILSYAENADGTVTTCTVGVWAYLNPGLAFERNVFGVELASLVDLGEEPIDAVAGNP